MNKELYNTTLKKLTEDDNIHLVIIMDMDIDSDLGLEDLGSGIDAIFPEVKEADELSALAKHLLSVVDEDLAESKFKYIDFYKEKNTGVIVARTDNVRAIQYLIENVRNTNVISRFIKPLEYIDDFMLIDTSNIRKEWVANLGTKDIVKEVDATTLKLSCVAARQMNDIVEVDDVVWILKQEDNKRIEAIVTILIDKVISKGSRKFIDTIEKHLGSNMSNMARRFLSNLNKVK